MTVRVRFDDDVEVFRAEVHAFLADAMAPKRVAGHRDPSDLTGLDEEFERTLLRDAAARGYLAPHLPVTCGGAGLMLAHRAAFGLEAAATDAPLIDTAVTLGGSPILQFGSQAQRTEVFGPMVRGEATLCVAYTEAQAGSDLGAIATSAQRVGTDDDADWVIDGTKVLVTGAHKADWCLLVARTDPDASPRAAMSMFLIRTDTPGVGIRRVRTANDWTLGEVRFDAARVPHHALLGVEGRGFAQMAAALADERSGFFWVGWAEQRIDELITYVRRVGVQDTALSSNVARDRLIALWIDVALARSLAMRVVEAQTRDDDATVLAALSKVFVTELLQRIASVGVALLGPAGLLTAPRFGATTGDAPLDGHFAYDCVERLHPTISVGSNEVQRDVLAHRGLGLPTT